MRYVGIRVLFDDRFQRVDQGGLGVFQQPLQLIIRDLLQHFLSTCGVKPISRFPSLFDNARSSLFVAAQGGSYAGMEKVKQEPFTRVQPFPIRFSFCGCHGGFPLTRQG
ncbi:Unknown protein sequence [Pseudomonas amygdali pv. sesami]|nr:Unknown protein sequence [Pseudomonas amygdali pv. sesami]